MKSEALCIPKPTKNRLHALHSAKMGRKGGGGGGGGGGGEGESFDSALLNGLGAYSCSPSGSFKFWGIGQLGSQGHIDPESG